MNSIRIVLAKGGTGIAVLQRDTHGKLVGTVPWPPPSSDVDGTGPADSFVAVEHISLSADEAGELDKFVKGDVNGLLGLTAAAPRLRQFACSVASAQLAGMLKEKRVLGLAQLMKGIAEFGEDAAVAHTVLAQLAMSINGNLAEPALYSLSKLPRTPEVVQTLLHAAKGHVDARVQSLAMKYLGGFGNEGRAVTGQIIELALADESPLSWVAAAAGEALLELDADLAPCIDELLTLALENSRSRGENAAELLAKVGQLEPDRAGQLRQAWDSNELLHSRVATILENRPELAKAVFGQELRNAHELDGTSQAGALAILNRLPSGVSNALGSELWLWLDDDRFTVVDAAVRLLRSSNFLGQAEPADAEEKFGKILSHPEPRIRQAAFTLILRCSRKISRPVLRDALSNPNADVVLKALELLKHAGEDHDESVAEAVLKVYVAANEPEIRTAAHEALVALKKVKWIRALEQMKRGIFGDPAVSDTVRELRQILPPTYIYSMMDPAARFLSLKLLGSGSGKRPRVDAVNDLEAWIPQDPQLGEIYRKKLTTAEELLEPHRTAIEGLLLGSRQAIRLLALEIQEPRAEGKLRTERELRNETARFVDEIKNIELTERAAGLGRSGYEIHLPIGYPAAEPAFAEQAWNSLLVIAGWALDGAHEMPHLEIKKWKHPEFGEIQQVDIKSGVTTPRIAARNLNMLARHAEWRRLVSPVEISEGRGVKQIFTHHTWTPDHTLPELSDEDAGQIITVLFFSAPEAVSQPIPMTLKYDYLPGLNYWGQLIGDNGKLLAAQKADESGKGPIHSQHNYFLSETVQLHTRYRFAGISSVLFPLLARAAIAREGPLFEIWKEFDSSLRRLGIQSGAIHSRQSGERSSLDARDTHPGAAEAVRIYNALWEFDPKTNLDVQTADATEFRRLVRGLVKRTAHAIQAELRVLGELPES